VMGEGVIAAIQKTMAALHAQALYGFASWTMRSTAASMWFATTHQRPLDLP